MADIMTWLQQRSFAEWVAVASLAAAILGLLFKNKFKGKTSVTARHGSVALGDNAQGNSIQVNQSRNTSNESER
ncbi:hypothetical protein [Bowmanella denitrificans]|uniref:hypothetical protein n=1 Tax=Bowmanella denitrificans TaxID=366582 RepID=UPI000C9C7FC1|nr:hypothetical protein [Bowmanella denitrificans]